MYKHQSKSEHANKLMQGHSHHKSEHAHKLMGGNHHKGGVNPAHVLMREHHAPGGASGSGFAGSFKKGGRACHAGGGREHHFWGALAGQVLPMVASAAAPYVVDGAKALYNKVTGRAQGGRTLHRAMGGAGKVRKGIMTEKGKIR